KVVGLTPQVVSGPAKHLAPSLVGPDYAGEDVVTQHVKIPKGETFRVRYGTKIARSLAELCDDPAKKLAGCGAGLAYDPANYVVNEDGFLVSRTTYHTKNETFLKYVDPTGASVVKIADVNPDFNLSFTTNLRFQGFTAYALVDWVQGGK